MSAFIAFALPVFLLAGEYGDTTTARPTEDIVRYLRLDDSVEKAMKYQTGIISLYNGIAQLNVPEGFKYLNK